MELVELKTYDSSILANIAKSKLNACGIESFIFNENISSILPFYYNLLGRGVRLMVLEDDFERAKSLLMPSVDGKCPNCGSIRIKRTDKKISSKLKLVFLALLIGPIGNLLNDFQCEDCGHNFKI